MSDEPRGVYKTQGENGKPNTVTMEIGTIGVEISEQEYRDNKYDPAFDDLPWGDEYHAEKKNSDSAKRA